MANRYANLVGSNKIKDEYTKINTGFDKVEEEIDAHVGAGGNAHATATTSSAGFMSAADKQKLDGIEEGAQVNQNAYAKVNGMEADDPSDEVVFEGGTGITVTQNPNEKKVIITATGEATPGPHGSAHLEFGSDPIPYATDTTGGLMSAEDKQAIKDLLGEVSGLRGELDTQKTDVRQRSINIKSPPPPLVAAVGDGVTNDAPAIQGCIDYVHSQYGGGKVYAPPGRYLLNNNIQLRSNISLVGAGMGATIFDIAGLGSTTASPKSAILGRGQLSDVAYALSADGVKGSRTITVDPGHDLAVGDVVLLSSDEQFETAAGLKRGEIKKIAAVNEDEITFEDGLFDHYPVSENAIVRKATAWLENITIDGIGFEGTQDENGESAIEFVYGENITVKNCGFKYPDHACVRLQSVVNFDVLHNVMEGYEWGTGPLHYGVYVMNACHNGLVFGNKGKFLRHLFTTGYTITAPGVARFVKVIGNSDSRSMSASYDTHAGSEYISFIGNTSSYSSESGINMRGPRNIVALNVIVNPTGRGIYVREGASDTELDTNYVFIENGLAGVEIRHGVKRVKVKGGRIDNKSNDGIYVYEDCEDISIEGVEITGVPSSPTRNGITLRNVSRVRIDGVKVATGRAAVLLRDNISRVRICGIDAGGCTSGVRWLQDEGTEADYVMVTGSDFTGVNTPLESEQGDNNIIANNFGLPNTA